MGFHHDEAEEEQVPFRLEGAAGADRHIVVTAAKRRWLDEHLERQWRRPPTAAVYLIVPFGEMTRLLFRRK